MHRIKQKLNSKKGSSLILVMVYFLFCVFVGGSVLVAATANSGRLVRYKASRQAYYSQRSAAVLLQSQLRGVGRLEIHNITEKTLTIQSGTTTTVTTSESKRADFLEPVNPNALQRLLLEAAENTYWENNETNDFFVDPSRVTKSGAAMNQSDLKASSGYLQIAVGDSASIPVKYTCSYTDEKDFADFDFEIQGADGESMFTVSVPANVTVSTTVGSESSIENKVSIVTRTDTENVVVIWGTPVIRKGGAD